MVEIAIGIRISEKGGISFLGFEEANLAIKRGANVVSVAPGDVIMNKLSEDRETVRLAFGGYDIKLILEENATSA